jgi:hypothetical protein
VLSDPWGVQVHPALPAGVTVTVLLIVSPYHLHGSAEPSTHYRSQLAQGAYHDTPVSVFAVVCRRQGWRGIRQGAGRGDGPSCQQDTSDLQDACSCQGSSGPPRGVSGGTLAYVCFLDSVGLFACCCVPCCFMPGCTCNFLLLLLHVQLPAANPCCPSLMLLWSGC